MIVTVPVLLGPAGEPAAGEREGDAGERDPARDAGVRGAGDGGRSAREEGRGAVPVGTPSKSTSRAVPHDGQNRCPSAARWAQVGQVAMLATSPPSTLRAARAEVNRRRFIDSLAAAKG